VGKITGHGSGGRGSIPTNATDVFHYFVVTGSGGQSHSLVHTVHRPPSFPRGLSGPKVTTDHISLHTSRNAVFDELMLQNEDNCGLIPTAKS
jgi:hypothetical protein